MAQILISGSSPGPPPEYSPPDELSNTSNSNETTTIPETSTITAQTDVLPMSSTTPALISNQAHSTHNHHRHHYHYHHRHRRDYRLARQLSMSLSQSNHHNHRLFHYHHHHSNSSGQNSRSLSNEKSPFLIVKILLFSLMTIDFVMNTIGLAVMIVIVKNHYNNFIVEHSFLIRSGYSSPTSTLNTLNHHYTPSPPGSLSMSLDSDFYANPSMTDSSNSGSAGSAAQSEWSLLLPLLPSFIFAEILTLIGMFGVFCDLFSFTMTYAILKLITSLCYPSMASVAAVAAMATATSSSGTSSTLNSMVMMPPGPPPPPSSLVNNFTANVDFVPMVVLRDISATTINNNSQKTTNVFFDDQSSFIQSLSLTTMAPNTADSLTTASPLFFDFTTTAVTNDNSTLFNNTNINGTMSSPELSTQQQLNKVTSSPMMVVKEQQTNYKNAGWLKNYEMINKDFRQMKKNDRLAKLKAREKQLRNRLLKLESLELIKNNNGGHHVNNQSSSLSLPLINRIKNGDKSKQWIFDSTQLSSSSSPLSSPPQNSNQLHLSSVLMPMDTNTHNIKYHHRVWDALLVTFEVIFAVAFAFNLLSNKRDQDNSHNNHHRNHHSADDEHLFDMDLDEDSSPNINGYIAHRHTTSSGRQRRNRIGYYRSRHHYWPYSPLATSIDAFYFTYFRLPPPPPPYFCNRNELSLHRLQSSENNQQASNNSSSNNRIRNQLARSLFEGRHFRRLTPSWLLYSGVRGPSIDSRARQNQSNSSGERRSANRTIVIDDDMAPPHYEDIEQDHPINIITLTHNTTTAQRPDDISVTIENDEPSQQSLSTNERIITLQVVGNDTSSASSNNCYLSNISEIGSPGSTMIVEAQQYNKNVETLSNNQTSATESITAPNSRTANIPTIIELVVNDQQQKDVITANMVNDDDAENNDNNDNGYGNGNTNHSQNGKMEQNNNNSSSSNNNNNNNKSDTSTTTNNNCSKIEDKEEITNKIKVNKKKK